MPELTSQDIDRAATDALINALMIKARQAIDEGKWILAATACRMIEELELDRTTDLVAAAAPTLNDALEKSIRERTVAVPLIRQFQPDGRAISPEQAARISREALDDTVVTQRATIGEDLARGAWNSHRCISISPDGQRARCELHAGHIGTHSCKTYDDAAPLMWTSLTDGD